MIDRDARVSTDVQSLDAQVKQLRAAGAETAFSGDGGQAPGVKSTVSIRPRLSLSRKLDLRAGSV